MESLDVNKSVKIKEIGVFKMIKGLTNFTRKSFKNHTTGEIFKNRNLIFGYNGRGKSSLADGIAEEFERTNSSNEGLYFLIMSI